MSEETFGDLFRRVRKEHHLTQADVAGLLCDISTISMIENDRWAPSWSLFHRLMEQIEGPSYFYAHFLSKKEGEREELRSQIEECLYRENKEKAVTLLGELKELCEDSIEGKKFFEIATLICFNEQMCIREHYIEECHRIFAMGRNSEQLMEHLEEWNADITLRRRDYDRMTTDCVDLLILNNLAIGHMWEQEYEISLKLFQFILSQLGREPYTKIRFWRMRGVLYYNSALVLFFMGEYERTLGFLRQAWQICIESGGLHLMARVVRLYLQTKKALGDEEYFYERSVCEAVLKVLPSADFWRNCSEEMFVL